VCSARAAERVRGCEERNARKCVSVVSPDEKRTKRSWNWDEKEVSIVRCKAVRNR
jgi:hypothetical protein